MSNDMMKEYSFGKIIDMVFESDLKSFKGSIMYNPENLKRQIYNNFALLINSVGSDVNLYKKGNKYIFYDVEVPFVKYLVKQLGCLCTDDENIIMKYIGNLEKNEVLSSEETFSLMQELINDAEEELSDDESKHMIYFFNCLLHDAPEHYLQLCHKAIDSMRVSLSPYTTTQQANFLSEFALDLKHDTSILHIRSIVDTVDFADTLVNNFDHYISNCNNLPYDIQSELFERDRSLFLKVKKDEELCALIEKRFDKKIEEIFKHVIE